MLIFFITNLFETYMDLHFTYLEINPLVVTENQIFILDLASKIDQAADYLCKLRKLSFLYHSDVMLILK